MAQKRDRAAASARPAGRIAVLDVGSNSVRLVVYDRLERVPVALFNEKALCGLGRGLEASGRLEPRAMADALATVKRFAALARAMRVEILDAVATAAVRDAANGPAFVAELEAQCGVAVRVLDGAEEARLSALGVLSALPGADGVMGDLGGGSLELVRLQNGAPGAAVSLPIGPLRLGPGAKPGKTREALDAALGGVAWLPEAAGRDLYIVGGSWRALGRVHMARQNYPLHVLHGYAVPAHEIEALAGLLAGLGRESVKRIEGVPKDRQDTLPAAALTLARVLRAARPARVVFSAYGLREGIVFDRLPPDVRNEDPLLAACRAAAERGARFPDHADELMAWTDPLFPNEAPADRRLRLAAALLSDVVWRVHPDYRAEHALSDVLHGPYVGLSHRERARLGLMLHARYTGGEGDELARRVRGLIGGEAAAAARRVGLAFRLAHTISGGAAGLLPKLGLRLEKKAVVLSLGGCPELAAPVVQRRLEQLAKAFDVEPRIAP